MFFEGIIKRTGCVLIILKLTESLLRRTQLLAWLQRWCYCLEVPLRTNWWLLVSPLWKYWMANMGWDAQMPMCRFLYIGFWFSMSVSTSSHAYCFHYFYVCIRHIWHFDGLVQERRNSSALAMVLRLSCINPWIWSALKASLLFSMDNWYMFHLYCDHMLHVLFIFWSWIISAPFQCFDQ